MEPNTTPVTEKSVNHAKWGPLAAIVGTVVIYFVSQLAAGLIVSLYPGLRGWTRTATLDWLDTPIAQFGLIVVVEGMTLAMLAWFLRRRKAGFRDLGLKKPHWADIGYALAGFVAYFAIYLVVLSIAQHVFPSINVDQEQQLGFSKQLAGFSLLYVFISLVLLPPIVEEILVRGFLYTGLKSKLPKIIAALIASAIFASAHLQAGSGAPLLWAAALDTFTLSMVLVFLREKTGGLAASMGVHMIKNTLAFIVLFDIARYFR